MAYLDTPRTDAGNQTYLSDAHNFQVENSFVSPLKKKDNLVLHMRNDQSLSIRTPRARHPFANGRKIHQAQAEFTPLLKSAVKGHQLGKDKVTVQTPSFTGNITESPIPRTSNGSKYYDEDQTSFTHEASNSASVPPMPSSSTQLTPLAMPSKDSNGVLAEQGNHFTLKEQENMLDKIEKENFGLKLKIHFFEKMLQSADTGFDEAAVKENMDLKVDKVTMQRELARTRKTLIVAEREVETYRLQIQQAQEKVTKRLSDENLQKELERLQRELEATGKENESLRRTVESLQQQRQANIKLEEDIQNLQAELRERDCMLDSREDEIDDLKEQASQDMQNIVDLEEDLASTKQQLTEVQKVHDGPGDFDDRLQESEDRAAAAVEQCEAILLEKQKVEEALRELQTQLSSKSLDTEGLNRQLEERICQLQTELEQLHTNNSTLRQNYEQQAQIVIALEQQTRDLKQQIEAKEQSLRENTNMLESKRHLADEREGVLKAHLQTAHQSEQKRLGDLNNLQHHHDALSKELQRLQKESSDYRAQLADAEKTIDQYKQSIVNYQGLSDKAREELESLTSELHGLRKQLRDAQTETSANKKNWKAERRALELQREEFKTRSNGLEEMVKGLQDSAGNSFSRVRLQETLISERQRFEHEVSTLKSHVQQLQDDLNEKGHVLQNTRTELTNAQGKFATLEQSQAAYEDQIQGLEDEIEVLQCSLEECNDARREFQAVTKNSEDQIHELKRTVNQQEPDINFQKGVHLRGDPESIKGEKSSVADRLAQAQYHPNAYNKVHESNEHEPYTSGLELRTEVIKLQRKLTEAGEDTAKLRAEFTNREADCEQKILAHEKMSRIIADHEQSRNRLERDLSEAHKQLRRTMSKNEAHAETCEKLRRDIQALEKSLADAQASKVGDISIAMERGDLHELLKQAKLEAEDLQTRLQEREVNLQRSISEEKSLRYRLDDVQEDRTKQEHQIAALFSELETLQRCYETSVESLEKKQREWNIERKTISKVRFLDTSVNGLQASEKSLLHSLSAEKREAEKRHAAEIRGLAKQILWMKAKQSREESFRAGLIFEKKFLLLQVEMFNACNALDLRLLEGMGVASGRKPMKMKPTIKIVAIMILAGVRLRRLQHHWASQKKIQASIAKKVVQMRHSKTIGN